jgi:aspartate carbamoyltransferase catalytic subunit
MLNPKPRKDLLDIESLEREEIEFLLKTAQPFKDLFKKSVKKVPPLTGRTVLTLFYEPSTRTRSSFEVAAKRLSADVNRSSTPWTRCRRCGSTTSSSATRCPASRT